MTKIITSSKYFLIDSLVLGFPSGKAPMVSINRKMFPIHPGIASHSAQCWSNACDSLFSNKNDKYGKGKRAIEETVTKERAGGRERVNE